MSAARVGRSARGFLGTFVVFPLFLPLPSVMGCTPHCATQCYGAFGGRLCADTGKGALSIFLLSLISVRFPHFSRKRVSRRSPRPDVSRTQQCVCDGQCNLALCGSARGSFSGCSHGSFRSCLDGLATCIKLYQVHAQSISPLLGEAIIPSQQRAERGGVFATHRAQIARPGPSRRAQRASTRGQNFSRRQLHGLGNKCLGAARRRDMSLSTT